MKRGDLQMWEFVSGIELLQQVSPSFCKYLENRLRDYPKHSCISRNELTGLGGFYDRRARARTWIFKIAELDPANYLDSQDSNVKFTEAGKKTMIAKLLENRDTGFSMIYEDAKIKVYQVENT